jgi:Uma2 family endonuclease
MERNRYYRAANPRETDAIPHSRYLRDSWGQARVDSHQASFICIEVLSPEDRMKRVQERIADYLEMGMPYVWVLNPETKQAYAATPAEGLREIKTGILTTEDPALEISLREISPDSTYKI